MAEKKFDSAGFAAREYPIYTGQKITPNTYAIHNGGCISYLLLGDYAAIMIDSGMSTRNLYDFVRTLTDLPVLGVINTHGHLDHSLGNGYFKKAYMHPEAVKDVKSAQQNSPNYPTDYKIETVEEGWTIDMGGRELEVIYIGAHSLGSMAILDKDYRILFTGDELDPGQVLVNMSGDYVPGQTVENHQKNMLKLKERAWEYDFICPAHNGTPIDKSYVDDFIVLDQMIMDGVPGREDITSPTLPFPRPDGCLRQNYKCAHMCYHPNTIFEK